MELRRDDTLEVGGREVPVSAYEAGMVRMLEYRPKVVRFTSELVLESVFQSVPTRAERASIDVFDDPFLSTKQWHYYNDGTFMNAVAGCRV